MPGRRHSTTLCPFFQLLTFFLPHLVNFSVECTKPKESRMFLNINISQSKLFAEPPICRTPQTPAAHTPNIISRSRTPKPLWSVQCLPHRRRLKAVCHCWISPMFLFLRGSRPTTEDWDFLEKVPTGREDRLFLKNFKGNSKKATIWYCVYQTQTLYTIHKRQTQWPLFQSPTLHIITIMPNPGMCSKWPSPQ